MLCLQALDTFNAGNRHRSLVELHQDRLAAEKKVRRCSCKPDVCTAVNSAEVCRGGRGLSTEFTAALALR